MTESNRDAIRAAVSDGWAIAWGDLITESDPITLAVSIPNSSVDAWINEQIAAQVQKFGQKFDDIDPDVIAEAKETLQGLLNAKHSKTRNINGIEVKAGIATYQRWVRGPRGGKDPVPSNHQPYIGIQITKPLPTKPKSVPAQAEESTPTTAPNGTMTVEEPVPAKAPELPVTTEAPNAPAAVQEPAPRAPSPDPTRVPWDSTQWYRIRNVKKPGLAVDVVNDGTQTKDGKLQMATEGNFSGQHWQLRPSKMIPGTYNLVTLWLGVKQALDVYGNDMTRPHLPPAGNYSGQYWRLENWGDGTWKMTNLYSGTLVLAADATGNGLHLVNPDIESASHWTLQVIRPITEQGFAL